MIVAIQPVRTLDIVALLDAFAEANRLAERDSQYDVQVVSSAADRNLTNRGGFSMQAALSYQDCFEAADTLLVAGSEDGRAIGDMNGFGLWLQRQANQSRRIGAVSSGALVLAEQGLLNGKKATTHWQFCDLFAARYPRVALQPDLIYVKDSNVYTCAGATAGMDLALTMIEEDLGALVAAKVAQSMVLSFRRSGAMAQISAALRAQTPPVSPIAALLAWLPDNLQEDLSIKTLARRSAMSPRNFARLFIRKVGVTPAKHIENLRLYAAQSYLESTDFTVEGVAFAAGFENGETLRRLFLRRLGMTPGRYRALKTVGH